MTTETTIEIENTLGYAITIPAGKGQAVTFKRGVTELDQALVEKAKRHPACAAAFEAGNLRSADEAPATEAESAEPEPEPES